MASFDKLAPFILHWETGARITSADTAESAYAKASAKGVATVRGDRGGATMCGVTIATYSDYRRRHGKAVTTEADLARMDYATWRDIAKSGFWDRCKADNIVSQGVANMLVDWCYTSGINAISATQRALASLGWLVTADGVVGPKTLTALNGDSSSTFRAIKRARTDYYRRIAKGTNARFLTGWLNRTEAITLSSLVLR